MKKLKMDSSTPNFIRAALRVRLYDALETLSEIINDPDARAADKIKAINVLGQYGLDSADQAAVHLHAGRRSTGHRSGPPARVGPGLGTEW